MFYEEHIRPYASPTNCNWGRAVKNTNLTWHSAALFSFVLLIFSWLIEVKENASRAWGIC